MIRARHGLPPRTSKARVALVAALALTVTGGASFTALSASAATPETIWGSGTPANAVTDTDTSAVELGTRFTAVTGGQATGVRFYKAVENTGAHVGSLWTSTGSLLGRVSFSSETASGWQTASFSSPVTLTAGASYVVSYHTSVGRYVSTEQFSGTSSSSSLTVPSSNVGVYSYSASSTFPTQSWHSSQYWVDLTFSRTASTPASATPVQSSPTNASASTPSSATTATSTATTRYNHGRWSRNNDFSPTPTTSATPTAAASSATSATSAPTSAASSSSAPVTAAASTSAPTGATTKTSTKAPTTTAPVSSAGMTNCVSQPSRCGYPDATNTGIPAGTTLKRVPQDVTSGPGWTWDSRGWLQASSGAVVQNLIVSGSINLGGSNITVTNTRVLVGGESWGIGLQHATNAVISNTEIGIAGGSRLMVGIKDIYGDSNGTQVLRSNIVNTSTGVQIYGGLIQDNYIHDMGYKSGDHINGTTSNGSTTMMTIRHNTILNSFQQTDAISLFQDFGVEANRLITDNLVAGGGYTIYGGNNQNYGKTYNIQITNNRFSTIYFPNGGYYGPVTAFDPTGSGNVASGNYWDNNLSAVKF